MALRDANISELTPVAGIETQNETGNRVRGVLVDSTGRLLFSPESSSTSLSKAEDAAHASGDVGVMLLGVRNDSNTARTSADGDYSPIATDDAGMMKINSAPSTFDHGNKSSIGTTAVQITTASIVARHGVTVIAASDNPSRIVVGNSDVTSRTADATDGAELEPGASILVPINNANKVYVRAASGSTGRVSWLVA